MKKLKVIPEWAPHEVCLCAWPSIDSGWSEQDLEEVRREVLYFYKMVIAHQAQKLFVIVNDNYQAVLLRQTFSKDNLCLIEAPYKDVWMRDIGPINVKNSQGQPLLLKPKFNAWGAKYDYEVDDRLPIHLFNPVAIQFVKQVFEGGAVETNGELILVNQSCFDRARGYKDTSAAQKSLEDIFDIPVVMLDLPTLKGDDTDGHIDTMLRFFGKNDLFVDERIANSPKWAAARAKILSVNSNITIHTIVSPKNFDFPGTYINFYTSSSNSIIVPSYGLETDDRALAQYNSVLPDILVEHAPARALVKQYGSWHCYAVNILKQEYFND